MAQANCWEMLGCGRQAGGDKVHELGVCPAARPGPYSGVNRGEHGGRVCWAVAGTFCGGEVAGTCAKKAPSCAECEVFARVRREEGTSFQLLAPSQTSQRALVEQFVSIMSIIDSLNAVVYVADLETHALLFANPYAQELFGEDIVGAPCYRALQGDQAEPCAFCNNDLLVIEGEPGPPVVREVRKTAAGRWFLCIDKAIPWWDGRLVRMEVAVDITERKQADEFRDQYVSLISHDLGTPLASLMLRAEMLRHTLEAKGLPAEADAASGLLASARRMGILIGDLVETTRLESGRIELHKLTIDLCEWAANAPLLAPVAERDRVEVCADCERFMVLADANRLDRVLENLLANALEHSGAQEVTVAVRRRGGEALISVSDKGAGVAPAELPRLFDRFYRAKGASRSRGLGLGLYNARLIVEAHGGRIWAESELGRGTDFYVALPLLPSSA